MSFCRLLRRAFSTSTTATATATATIPKPKRKSFRSMVRASCAELYQERDPTRLVQKFKDSSDLYHFRAYFSIYEIIVRRLAKEKQFEAIEEILDHQKKYREFSKEGFVARLINLYGKAGMFDNAQKLFDEMPLRNVHRTVLSFTALLSACVKSKKLDMAEKIFREVPKSLSIEPNLVSYNTMISAYCDKGLFDSALSLIDEMEKKGVVPDAITYNKILDCYYRKGRFEEAEKIWALMVEKNVAPDTWSYNSKLVGLALKKRSEEGPQLVEEMKKNRVKPDGFTFDSLIKGFVDEGNLDEAKKWYAEIAKSGCVTDNRTFRTLVPFVCEKGDVGYAFELCKDILKCRRRVVREELLQAVVDGLAKASRMEEAEELVELGNTNGFHRCNLKLPSE